MTDERVVLLNEGGKRLAEWRIAKEMIRPDMAKKLGIRVSMLGHLETGRRLPSLKLAAEIERITRIAPRLWVEEVHRESE